MKYYTSTIPVTLAEKLKEKGMPVDIDCDTFDSGTEYQKEERWCNNTYAEVFDYMMEKGIRINLHTYPAREPFAWGYILWMGYNYMTLILCLI